MGKIITGEEFVDLVMECYEGYENEPNTNSVAEALSSYLSISCEYSNKCSAYGSTTPHGQEIDLYSFWEWICGTGMNIIGDQSLTFQLRNSSQYTNKKLIDSDNLYTLRDHMRCTYIPLSDSATFKDYTGGGDGDTSSRPPLVKLDFYIYLDGYWLFFATMNSIVYDRDTIPIDYYYDFVIGGSSNFLNDSKTYNFRIDIRFETTDTEYYSSIDSLNVAIDGPNGGLGISTVFNEEPDTGNGYSFSVSGSTTLGNFKEISAICIYGTWVGDSSGGGSNDYYSDLYITSCYIATSNSGNRMYVTGATNYSTVLSSSAKLYPVNRIDMTTEDIDVYIDASDMSSGEITLRFPEAQIGEAEGNYLLPIVFSYYGKSYKLFFQIELESSGRITISSSEAYIELSYSTTVRLDNNKTSGGVTVRALSSIGYPQKYVSPGSELEWSPSINKIHVYPSSTSTNVMFAVSDSDGTVHSSYTVATNISNNVISVIPYQLYSNFSTFIVNQLSSDSSILISFS